MYLVLMQGGLVEFKKFSTALEITEAIYIDSSTTPVTVTVADSSNTVQGPPPGQRRLLTDFNFEFVGNCITDCSFLGEIDPNADELEGHGLLYLEEI
jgi:hypothetical protein